MRKAHILLLIGIIILFANAIFICAEENETANETIINDTSFNETLPDDTNFTIPDFNQTNETDEILNESGIINETAEINETEEINETIVPECIENIDCDDENESTTDFCTDNLCEHELNIIEENLTIIPPKFSVISASYFFRMFTFGLHGILSAGPTLSARILLNPFQSGSRNGISGSYSANIGFFGNTAPYPTVTINTYSIYPRLAPNGSIIRFSISATNAEAVWARITLPDGSTTTINLINGGDAYYTAVQVGTYDVVFYANSSLGLLASAIDSFETYLQTPGGGGGGGGGGAACTYDWRCSPWSSCTNNVETRTCANIGTCTGTLGKPEETKSCLGILFDISIKLESLEMTEGDHLLFNVTLIEKNNVEKVDVQVKYTLFDKDMNEIFSQIETKAVEKELTYRKILDDLRFAAGEYTIKVEIFYGDAQKASAEQKFAVNEKKEIIIEKKKFPWKEILAILIVLAAIALLIALLKKKKRPKHEKGNRLSQQIGKDVYSDDGKMLGKVAGIHIEGNKIYGWLVKASEELQKDIKKDHFMIMHRHVKSVGEAIVVDGRITDYLNETFK